MLFITAFMFFPFSLVCSTILFLSFFSPRNLKAMFFFCFAFVSLPPFSSIPTLSLKIWNAKIPRPALLPTASSPSSTATGTCISSPSS